MCYHLLLDKKRFEPFIMIGVDLDIRCRFHFGIRRPATGLMVLFCGTTMLSVYRYYNKLTGTA